IAELLAVGADLACGKGGKRGESNRRSEITIEERVGFQVIPFESRFEIMTSACEAEVVGVLEGPLFPALGKYAGNSQTGDGTVAEVELRSERVGRLNRKRRLALP